jgi:hypothetical protein
MSEIEHFYLERETVRLMNEAVVTIQSVLRANRDQPTTGELRLPNG